MELARSQWRQQPLLEHGRGFSPGWFSTLLACPLLKIFQKAEARLGSGDAGLVPGRPVCGGLSPQLLRDWDKHGEF